MEIAIANFCKILADETVERSRNNLRNIVWGKLDGNKFEGVSIKTIITYDGPLTYGIYSGENVIELTNAILAPYNLAVEYNNSYYLNLVFNYFRLE